MSEYRGNIQISYSTEVSHLENAPGNTKTKKLFLTIAGAAIIGGIVVGVGYAGEQEWLKITGYIVGGIILIGGIFMSANAKIAKCVYCDGTVGEGVDDTISKMDENERIKCPHCWEWLISNEGELRAYTAEDENKKGHFDAPAFENGVWPDECIICGDAVAKLEKAKNTKLNAEKLLLGKVSVSWGSIDNIPYCTEHTGVVEMKIKEDYMYVRFPELDMMKRYLVANEGRMDKRIKFKGRLEKMVSKK